MVKTLTQTVIGNQMNVIFVMVVGQPLGMPIWIALKTPITLHKGVTYLMILFLTIR